jgi:hypothetical protein
MVWKKRKGNDILGSKRKLRLKVDFGNKILEIPKATPY